MLALVRSRVHVSLEMLIQRALVAHALLTNVAGELLGVILVSLVDLSVAFQRVVGGEGGTALFTFELFQPTVQLDVILQ